MQPRVGEIKIFAPVWYSGGALDSTINNDECPIQL